MNKTLYSTPDVDLIDVKLENMLCVSGNGTWYDGAPEDQDGSFDF